MPAINEWHADHVDVWRETIGGQVVSLRHPTYPAEATWNEEHPTALRSAVKDYLAHVWRGFGLGDPADIAGFLDQPPFVLLPFDPSQSPGADPRSSFWLRRFEDPNAGSGEIDGTAIFLAVEAWRGGTRPQVLGSRRGVVVSAQIGPKNRTGIRAVRITGSSRSLSLPSLAPAAQSEIAPLLAPLLDAQMRIQIKQQIVAAAGLPPETRLWFNGVRLRLDGARPKSIEVFSEASVPASFVPPGQVSDRPALALTASITLGGNQLLRAEIVERAPLVAHAAAPVRRRLFPRDPATMAERGKLQTARPNRSPAAFEGLRHSRTLKGVQPNQLGQAHLSDDLGLVAVMQSRIVDGAADEASDQVHGPADAAHARCNEFAALSAYQHARGEFDEDARKNPARPLFDTIAAYGLSPAAYFRLARLPLRVRYRARLTHGTGRGGKTVNAQVTFDPPECDRILGAEWNADTLRHIEARFALADLQRTWSRREPLGLTADARWSWHEYSHVLLAAVTGMLELPFVHSLGDSLAAILNDPWSKLAQDASGRSTPEAPSRGMTYPWVYLNRRHDRSPSDGWSWSGRRHRPDRFADAGCNCRLKGYESEQILSSSLFRLYRALGGDTVDDTGRPDRAARMRAADYCAYLVLRAIRSMPPAFLRAIETPDQLVTALADADAGTRPTSSGPLAGRVGGWAHKVVRWAFEAQGLYPGDPAAVNNAPGEPPPIDVFIDNRRPDSAGRHPRGGYMPVSLDWHDPLWHASREAIEVLPRLVRVRVRNRGNSEATRVKVKVWQAEWPMGRREPPPWNVPDTWKKIGASMRTDVPAQGERILEFQRKPFPTRRRRLILVIATCAGDRANTAPRTGLPTSTEPIPLVDLVAGDNNLGLRLYNGR